jgi:hypothetical protein
MSKKTSRKKTHAEQLEELDRKIWVRKRNLGSGDGPDGTWTLCGIGAEGSYINLDGTTEINSVKEFWDAAARLITNENVEYVFENKNDFHNILFKAVFLLYYFEENYSIRYIEEQLKTMEKWIRIYLHKNQNHSETQGDAFIALAKVFENLEKDFLKIEDV